MQRLRDKYRRTLTNHESILSYGILGMARGIASGLIVMTFERAIVELATLWVVSDGGESFEAATTLASSPLMMHAAHIPVGD